MGERDRALAGASKKTNKRSAMCPPPPPPQMIIPSAASFPTPLPFPRPAYYGARGKLWTEPAQPTCEKDCLYGLSRCTGLCKEERPDRCLLSLLFCFSFPLCSIVGHVKERGRVQGSRHLLVMFSLFSLVCPSSPLSPPSPLLP